MSKVSRIIKHRGVSYVVDPRSSTSKVAMSITKLVPYIGNFISEGDDFGEPCKMGIPRERKARREQIIAYLNESMVKMCSRPQNESVAKAIVASKTGK